METKKTTKQEKFDAVTLVKSERYRPWRDLLCAELEEGKLYSHDEIEKIIKTALAKPVQKDIIE